MKTLVGAAGLFAVSSFMGSCSCEGINGAGNKEYPHKKITDVSKLASG